MKYLLSTVTYAGIAYLLAIVVLMTGAAIGGDPIPQPNTPGVVDRADGWPESKAKHQEPGDLFSMLERVHFPSTYTWLYDDTDEYKKMELWVWCLLLPLGLGLMIGSLVARYRSVSWLTTILLGALYLYLAVIAAGIKATTFYDILWDLSIVWANMFGMTYYGFTVFTFITIPATILLGGIMWHAYLWWEAT